MTLRVTNRFIDTPRNVSRALHAVNPRSSWSCRLGSSAWQILLAAMNFGIVAVERGPRSTTCRALTIVVDGPVPDAIVMPWSRHAARVGRKAAPPRRRATEAESTRRQLRRARLLRRRVLARGHTLGQRRGVPPNPPRRTLRHRTPRHRTLRPRRRPSRRCPTTVGVPRRPGPLRQVDAVLAQAGAVRREARGVGRPLPSSSESVLAAVLADDDPPQAAAATTSSSADAGCHEPEGRRPER